MMRDFMSTNSLSPTMYNNQILSGVAMIFPKNISFPCHFWACAFFGVFSTFDTQQLGSIMLYLSNVRLRYKMGRPGGKGNNYQTTISNYQEKSEVHLFDSMQLPRALLRRSV